MAAKKNSKDPKSERIEALLATRQLFDEQLRELGYDPAPAESVRVAPPTSSTLPKKLDGDRTEVYAQITKKEAMPANRTKITLTGRHGQTWFWYATSTKGASLDRGEWYSLKGRVTGYEGSIPVLHYVLVVDEEGSAPKRRAR